MAMSESLSFTPPARMMIVPGGATIDTKDYKDDGITVSVVGIINGTVTFITPWSSVSSQLGGLTVLKG